MMAGNGPFPSGTCTSICRLISPTRPYSTSCLVSAPQAVDKLFIIKRKAVTDTRRRKQCILLTWMQEGVIAFLSSDPGYFVASSRICSVSNRYAVCELRARARCVDERDVFPVWCVRSGIENLPHSDAGTCEHRLN